MKKTKNYIYILIIVLFISIAYAVLTAQLNFSGSFTFNENTFKVYLDKIVVENTSLNTHNVGKTDDSNLSVTATFKKPGDFIEFSFYAINAGTIDASLEKIEFLGIDTSLEKYFDKSVKYIDDTTATTGDFLQAGAARKLITRIEYKYDIEELIPIENININVNISYIQPKATPTVTWNYEYIDEEQYFIAPRSGTYKLETWGAQGASSEINSMYGHGGYGGYSTGIINLQKKDLLNIVVGGQGKSGILVALEGGYNGGGSVTASYNATACNGSGGGATHIATEKGTLNVLKNKLDKIIIVSGGGGGSHMHHSGRSHGGSGGGYIGMSPINIYQATDNCTMGEGGTQTSGGRAGTSDSFDSTHYTEADFGLGSNYIRAFSWGAGGGGGYYGGSSGLNGNRCAYSASGGSGYIGNSLLTEKVMYCYNCEESSEESTKTISTTNVSEVATSQYAKIGNGYAKITYLG